MTTIAIVPVQHLSLAKSRLAGRLTPAERRLLVVHLLGVVLDALHRSSLVDQTIIITPDQDVIPLVERGGAIGLLEKGTGLNPAIRQARDQAIRLGTDTLLVMLGDLPLVRPCDIDDLLRSAEGADVVLASDRQRRGTNALVLRPPGVLEPAFGPGSYPAHRTAAIVGGLRVQEFWSPEIAFDVDVDSDLAELDRLGVNWSEAGEPRMIEQDSRGHIDRGSEQTECGSQRVSPAG